jgi:NAD+ kinase
MKSTSIIVNPKKTGAVALGAELAQWLQDQRVLVMAEHEGALAMGAPQLSRDVKELATADFALVMGGDGTLLHASHALAPAGVPMLAIRFGNFGFLTDTMPKDAKSAITRILEGEYTIDERMMLQSRVFRGNSALPVNIALNDMVITKGPLSRMLHLRMSVNGRYVSTYAADGLIVASPTGSTAYSLSAGGPLVAPDLEVILITPICPHTLNARSLIISSGHTVEVIVEGEHEDTVMLTVDGQSGIRLETGDTVSIGQANHKARLLCVSDISFFDKLQSRLRWGDRFDS